MGIEGILLSVTANVTGLTLGFDNFTAAYTLCNSFMSLSEIGLYYAAAMGLVQVTLIRNNLRFCILLLFRHDDIINKRKIQAAFLWQAV